MVQCIALALHSNSLLAIDVLPSSALQDKRSFGWNTRVTIFFLLFFYFKTYKWMINAEKRHNIFQKKNSCG